MITLAQELRERVRNRAQHVGLHTALLELREAATAVSEWIDPGGGRFLTEEELEAETEQAVEEAAGEAHSEGHAEGVKEGHAAGFEAGVRHGRGEATIASPWGR